ncbi:MAG: hypothetical protein AAFX93_02405 [Verrucomicrobiota bacterium]
MKNSLITLLILCFVACVTANAQNFIEQNGLVVMEAESADLPAKWVKKTTVPAGDPDKIAGFTGDGYIEWTGGFNGGLVRLPSEGVGVIKYTFTISTPGVYSFRWRTKQKDAGQSSDAGNDTYVRWASGTPAGSHDWTNFTKVWIQSKTDWVLNVNAEPHHGQHIRNDFKRQLNAGTHSIEIAARSAGHVIDRLIVHHSSVPYNANQFATAPESPRGNAGPVDSVSCASYPTSMPSQSSYTVDVPYTASQQRELIATLYKGGVWQAAKQINVPAGSSTASVTVNLPAPALPGSDYEWRAAIRPLGTDWTQNLDFCTQPNVAIVSNVPAAGVAFDDESNYLNQSFEVGGTLPVTVDYSAGSANTVNGDGVKFWLRHLRSDWSVVRDVIVFDAAAANSVSGTASASLSLTADLIPTASLPAGDFYFLYVSFIDDQGNSRSIGTQPVVISAAGGPAPAAGISFDDESNYQNQSFEAGGSLPISVDYSAGERNTVGADGIKFWLRHLRSDWSLVRDVTLDESSAANTVSGSLSVELSLPADLISTTNLPAGDFYFLWVSFLDDQGNNQNIGTQPIIITGGTGGIPQTIVLDLTDDAYIQNSSAFNTNQLRVQPTVRTSYLKFDLSSVSGSITAAKLILNVSADAGSGTLRVSEGTSDAWSEAGLDAASAPGVGSELGSVTGSFLLASDVEVDLDPMALNGVLSLILTLDGGGNDVWFSSKEGAISPRLEVTYQP